MTSIAPKHFPDSVWTGLCFQYDSLNIDKYPDFFWSDQCSKEIIAVEEYLLQPAIQDLFTFFQYYGAANSFVGVNSTQSALTYRTLVAGPNIAITYPNETTCLISVAGGDIGFIVTSGDTFLEGMVLYVDDATGNALKADSTSEVTSTVYGLADADVTIGNTVKIIPAGKFELTDWTAVTGSASLDNGKLYYLSSTPGMLTLIPPTIGYLLEVGRAVSDIIMDIDIKPRVRL